MKISDVSDSSQLSELAKKTIQKGNVYRIPMDEKNGITPKNVGDLYRNKFFIVLGFMPDGAVYGGVIINSEINKSLPIAIQKLHIPIQRIHYNFLVRDSYVNCSDIKRVNINSFSKWQYLGVLNETDFNIIVETLQNSPSVSKAELEYLGIGVIK